MRRLHFYLDLPDEKAAEFERGVVMITPLNPADIPRLQSLLNGVGAFLARSVKVIRTLREVTEGRDADRSEILKTIVMLAEPAEVAAALHDEIREKLGRAVFVSPGAGKGEMLQ